MTTQQKYEAELEKLRHLATAGRDFTPEGDERFFEQFKKVKRAYWDMCYEGAKPA